MGSQRDEWIALGLDPEEMHRLPPAEHFAKYAEARLAADLAALDARDAAAQAARDVTRTGTAAGPLGVGSTNWRQQAGPTAQLSVRLDRAEMDLLRRRAESAGLGVSVLARAYLRQQLAVPVD